MTESQKDGILFVDDEEDILELLQDLVKDMPVEAHTANSPSKAISIAETNSIHLAVLDLSMPEMDGITLFRRLKAIQPDLQGIFLTGFGTKETAQQAIRMEACDFVDKPYDPDGLKEIIKRALEKGRKERVARASTAVVKMINARRGSTD